MGLYENLACDQIQRPRPALGVRGRRILARELLVRDHELGRSTGRTQLYGHPRQDCMGKGQETLPEEGQRRQKTGPHPELEV